MHLPMTWMRLPFKKALVRLLIVLAVMASAFAAQAGEFRVGRGINFDQWVTWPQRPDWARPRSFPSPNGAAP